MSIALVTDSSSQLSPELAARFSARVVPVTVTIDGTDHREGVDITADGFYELLRAAEQSGHSAPEVATTQPSAAAFVAAFEEAVADGADSVLAILVGSVYSGAVNSAEVAARTIMTRHADVAVSVIDSGAASFGISCALWAAAGAIGDGAGLDQAGEAALDRAARTSSVFVIDGLELARRSGRFGQVDLETGDEVMVFTSGPAGLDVIGNARTVAEALDLMVGALVVTGEPVTVAVGRAGPQVDDVTTAFRNRLLAEPSVVDLVDYRVGPSIAVHTGPATVGAFVFPV